MLQRCRSTRPGEGSEAGRLRSRELQLSRVVARHEVCVALFPRLRDVLQGHVGLAMSARPPGRHATLHDTRTEGDRTPYAP